MNLLEYHAEIELLLDQISSEKTRKFLPNEIDKFISLAQRQIAVAAVEQYVALDLRIRPLQRVVDLPIELSSLIVEVEDVPINKTADILTHTGDNIYYTFCPQDLIYPFFVRGLITRTNYPPIANKLVAFAAGNINLINIYVKTGLNSPHMVAPIWVINKNMINLFIDQETTIHAVSYNYFSMPPDVNSGYNVITGTYLEEEQTNLVYGDNMKDKIIKLTVQLMVQSMTLTPQVQNEQ